MAECPSCGHNLEGDPDFCPECGEYLRWEQTGYQKAVEPEGPTEPLAPEPPESAAPTLPLPQDAAAGTPPPPAPPPATPPKGTPGQQSPQAPEAATVTLRLPGEDSYAEGELRAGVEPGGQTLILALIRNQSGIVENYDLVVEGLPGGWWTIEPNTVYLVPFGSRRGEFEQEVEVALHPPRSGDARSGDWQIRVVATPRSASEITSSAPATVEVSPFQQLEAELTPKKRNGRLEANFELTVINRGNAPLDVSLAADDTEEACEFAFRAPTGSTGAALLEGVREHGEAAAKAGAAQAKAIGRSSAQQAKDAADPLRGGVGGPEAALRGAQNQAAVQAQYAVRGGVMRGIRNVFRRGKQTPPIAGLTVPAGDHAKATLDVVPKAQLWIGRSKLHAFQATVQPVGEDTGAVQVNGALNQKPWLPWWLAIVALLVVVAGIFLWINRPVHVTVPDVTALADIEELSGVEEARAALQSEGLELGKQGNCLLAEDAAGDADAPDPCPPSIDPDAEPGDIVSQFPLAGEKIDKGGAVDITIAVAAEIAPVPKVTGGTYENAVASLEGAGFTVGRLVDQPSENEATALIRRQIPPPGEMKPLGSPIALVFAPSEDDGSEPAPVVPPVAERTDANQGRAQTEGNGERTQADGETPPGPELATVPDLVGRAQIDAEQLVLDAGLRPRSFVVGGFVAEQDLTPGSVEALNTSVRVVLVGQEPIPPTSDDDATATGDIEEGQAEAGDLAPPSFTIVPDLFGLILEDAMQKVKDAGLVLEFERVDDPRVTGQSPGALGEAERGSVVRIEVSPAR